MNWIILGIDGLEYNKVKEFDLKNLKQKEYGKVEIPLSGMENEALTPVIWASFLTGLTPEEHKINSFKLNPVWELFKKIRFLKLVWRPVRFLLGNNLERLGLMGKFPKLKAKTFLDAQNSLHYNVPFYDFDFEKDQEPTRKYLEGKISEREFKRIEENKFFDFKIKVLDILSNSEREFSVFMCYTHFLDSIQHCFYKEEEYVNFCYKLVNNFVEDLKNLVPKKTKVLIISDHGHLNGNHTDYGFYSCNERLGFKNKNPKITDFFEIIDERRKIFKRLKRMGYF